MQSLQAQYAPHNACFGCGQANKQGLMLESIPHGAEVVVDWQCQPFHEAFPGMLSGGIIGTLLDCHSNWSAAYFIMQAQQDSKPPCTVTAEYHVKLKQPTPSDSPVRLIAKLKMLDLEKGKAVVVAEMQVGGIITATCEGVFVAVKPGHPAYHRW